MKRILTFLLLWTLGTGMMLIYGQSFSVTEVTAILGEWDMENSPQLETQMKGIVYSSSHPEVAVVLQDSIFDPVNVKKKYLKGGTVVPIAEGTTVITAFNPENNKTASYTLHVVYQSSSTTGTSETITVSQPGSLRELMSNLESTRVRDLTLHGKLNADDLKYLHESAGRLQNIESIDMKDVTFEYGGEAYATATKKVSGFIGSITHYYYLSDENRKESDGSGNLVGGYDGWVKHYSNRLDALFSGVTTLRRVVWPDCVKGIGEDALAGSGIVSFIFPSDITFIGDGAFSNCTNLYSVNVPSTVTEMGSAFNGCTSIVNVGNLSHMKKIEASAFKGCNFLIGNVKDMTLDLSNVDTIPENAFYYCRLLHKVKFAKVKYIGQSAFYDCWNLKQVNIPKGIDRIDSYAFYGCKSLSEVVIPSSVRQMNFNSFYGTPYQENMPFENGIKYLGHIAVESHRDVTELNFKEGTRVIADDFIVGYNKTDITTVSITLPSTIKRIGNAAFNSMYGDESSTGGYYALSLESINLPEGLEEIGHKAFINDKNLTGIKLPSSLKYLGSFAFEKCLGLDQITIPEATEQFGCCIFQGCTGLVQLKILSKAISPIEFVAGDFTYSGSDRDLYMCRNCTGLEKVVVGGEVPRIPDYMFYGCTNLAKVEFENRQTDTLAIGEWAFCGCSNLQVMSTQGASNVKGLGRAVSGSNLPRLEIPIGTTTIGENAFTNCTGIKDLLIPEGKTTIGRDAFYNCSNIKNIELCEGITTLNESVFEGCSAVEEIHLPSTMELIEKNALAFIKKYNEHPFNLYCAAVEPPTVNYAFQPVLTGCNLYVRPESLESYQNANSWKKFNVIADEALPVNDINVSNTHDTNIYDLSGRRVVNPKRGLYIQGNKKIIKQ
ncbi:MAG: leucine-rich repeat domain-containing protein [Bacteroidaceae bacterium]|nr:leucine-rich repeat domain-containing protein [Bacteroidaceae bacterium]